MDRSQPQPLAETDRSLRKRPITFSASRHRKLKSVAVALIFAVSCGCSGSLETEPSPTTASEASATMSSQEIAAEPPATMPAGSFELPPNGPTVPGPNSDGPTAADGGFRLPDGEPMKPDGNSGADTSSLGGSAASELSLQTRPWSDIQSSLPSNGVVVVDLWSLSCAPCLRELPELPKLVADMDGVSGVTVSLDYDGRSSRPPSRYTDDVRAFLVGIGAEKLTNFQAATPSDELLAEVDAVSMPVVMVYQDGQLVRTFVDAGESLGFSYEANVRPYVESLLEG